MRGVVIIFASFLGFNASLGGQTLLPTTVVEADDWNAEEQDGALVPQGSRQEFTREEIEQSGQDSVLGFLQNEAGLPVVSLYGNSRSGSPSLRGFSGGSLGKVLILTDGVAVNRPDMATQDWGSLPLGQLETISVARGSRVVRYGSSALGGVIELETRRHDSETWAIELEGGVGSYGSHRERFLLESPGAGWGLSLSGENSASDGYRDNSGREDRSLSLSVDGPAMEDLESRWTFMLGETQFENPGGLSFDGFQRNPRQSAANVVGFEEFYFSEIETTRVGQNLNWQLGEGWSLASRSEWSREDRTINDGGFFADNELSQWKSELVARRDGERLDWEFGLRARYEKMDFLSFSSFDRSDVRQAADLSRASGALFAITEWSFAEDWTLRQGMSAEGYRLEVDSVGLGRFASAEDTFDEGDWGGAWASETALEYQWREETQFWLRHERVYRFPLLDEIAGYQGFLLDVPFNAELKPEVGDSVEVGVQYQGDALKVGLVGYGTWLDGEIAFQDDLNRNLAPSERWGTELSLGWRASQWQAELRYDWTMARLREGEFAGKDLPLVPRHRIFGTMRWEPIESLQFNVSGSYSGSARQGDDYANELRLVPSYAVFSAGAAWEPTEDLRVFVRVNNLFDRNYASYAAVDQFYPATGRDWSVGVQVKF